MGVLNGGRTARLVVTPMTVRDSYIVRCATTCALRHMYCVLCTTTSVLRHVHCDVLLRYTCATHIVEQTVAHARGAAILWNPLLAY